MNQDRQEKILPREFFSNSIRLYYAEEALQPLTIGALQVFLAVFTLLPSCMGTASTERSPALVLAWVLWAAHGLVMFATRGALERRRKTAFWVLMLSVGTMQGLWIQLLTWVHMDGSPSIATAILVGLYVAWAFNDARTAYDHPIVQASYATGLVAFWPALLVVDWLGGVGLVGTWATDRLALRDWLFIQGVVLLATQGILVFIGRYTYQLDLASAQTNAEARDQAVRDSERLVLQRASDVLGGELTTRRFSADLSSPIAKLHGGLELLRSGDLDAEQRQTLLDEMEGAIAFVQAMAHQASQSTQPQEATNRINSTRFAEMAVEEARVTLQEVHGVPPRIDMEDLADHPIVTAPGHSGYLAGLLVNAGLQHHHHQLSRPVELSGHPLDDWYYLLKVRDHGKPRDQAPGALARVRARLGLRMSEAGPRSTKYRGMGMGLALTKLQLVRHGGWVDARLPPDHERGIELLVVLPRVPPEAIPYEHSSPQRVLERWIAQESGEFWLDSLRPRPHGDRSPPNP